MKKIMLAAMLLSTVGCNTISNHMLEQVGFTEEQFAQVAAAKAWCKLPENKSACKAALGAPPGISDRVYVEAHRPGGSLSRVHITH